MPSFSGQLSDAADRRRRRLRRPGDARLILPADFPAARRGVRHRPRPHPDRRGRRAAGRAPRRRSPRALRGRDPRDHRHRTDVPVGAARTRRRPGSSSRSSATRARSSPSRSAAGSSATSRSRSSWRERRSPPSRPRASRSTATSATSSTSPSTRRPPSRTPRSSTSRCTRSAICSPGCRSRRRSSSASATRPRWTGCKERMIEHFDGRMYISKSLPYFLEFASPEVTKASGLGFLAERLGFARETHGLVRRRRERHRAARVGRLRGRGAQRARAGARRSPTSSARPCRRRAWRR